MMEIFHDYQDCAILYVDDEEMSLKYFTRAFGNKFRVLSAANASDGYRLLEQHHHEIGLLMTDQRMPGEKGVQFLERARLLHPRAIRILTTAYSDLDVAIEAVNSGAIYKYVTKPWDIPQLQVTLQRALEFFIVQRERDLLLKEKLSALQRMLITDRVLSLGILAARLGHYVRNSLVAVRTFLDLAPEKLLEEKIDAERMRNPNFWKEFYEQAQVQIRRITGLLTDLVIATEKNDPPSLEELHRDEGPGLPREELRSLFDPFSLRIGNHHEFGINLMACYFIIYHHGGKIEVQNQEGQGVTFSLTFPVRPKVASPAEEEEAFITKVLMNDAFWERLVAGEIQ